jgi:hypothetical protein
MSDYQADISILRGQMAYMLSSNEEQFIYVLSEAMTNITADNVIDAGQLSEDADMELVVFNLRKIADAIESGSVS